MRGIDKSFGSALVLRAVDFDVRGGEILGLMGPNGAGKSTLIKILAGVHRADAGSIQLLGKEVDNLAGRPEVGIVHQDLGLVDGLSILDNMMLGARPLSLVGPLLNRSEEIAAAKRALVGVGMEGHSVFQPVAALSAGEKALVAIGRLLDRGARVIVVDETTASLPPAESAWFIERLREAARGGTAVVMVSHRLAEIRSAADRLVLLADGEIAVDAPMSDFRARDEDLVELLMGEELKEVEPPDQGAAAAPPGRPLLELRGVRGAEIGPVDLELRGGEAVALTGRAGSGLYEIALAAAGVLPVEAGAVVVAAGARRALVPPQREVDGVFATMPALWNMSLSALPRWRTKARLLDLGGERAAAEEMVGLLNIQPPDLARPIGVFSGGNQQKVLFARAMLTRPDVFVLCEPTRGVDIRTRGEIYRLIERMKGDGRAVLIATSDVEDAVAVCDRTAVVEDGTITRFYEEEDLTSEVLAAIL
jgi:ribose transport system ATP-binding protein